MTRMMEALINGTPIGAVRSWARGLVRLAGSQLAASLSLVAFCVLSAVPASAQARADLYSVGGVKVDATAADAPAARAAAIAQGRRAAFDRLVRRIGFGPDLVAAGPSLILDEANLAQIASSIDVEEGERISKTRYLATIRVNFDPSQVRAILRERNVRFVEARMPPVLLAPIAAGGVGDSVLTLWRQAWSYPEARAGMAPLLALEAPVVSPDWASLQGAATSIGASSAMLAELRISPNGVSAELIEIGPGDLRRSRALATTSIPPPAGEAQVSAALTRLVETMVQRLNDDWKAQAVNRQGGSERLVATAAYRDIAGWRRVREAIGRSSLIGEIRIEAIATDGALLSIAYLGEYEQFRADLRQRGVILESGPFGSILRVDGP